MQYFNYHERPIWVNVALFIIAPVFIMLMIAAIAMMVVTGMAYDPESSALTDDELTAAQEQAVAKMEPYADLIGIWHDDARTVTVAIESDGHGYIIDGDGLMQGYWTMDDGTGTATLESSQGDATISIADGTVTYDSTTLHKS